MGIFAYTDTPMTQAANEKQTITITGAPDGGDFNVSWDGEGPSGDIAWNATAATVETALEGLANITAGDVIVTGAAGGPWTIEFAATYEGTDVAEMTCDGSGLTGGTTPDAVPATTVTGASATYMSDWRVTDRNDFIAGSVYADVDGTCFVEQSHDQANADISESIAVTGGTGEIIKKDLLLPYVRVRYVSTTDQTVFRLFAKNSSAGDS
jgi:hypothetical protein